MGGRFHGTPVLLGGVLSLAALACSSEETRGATPIDASETATSNGGNNSVPPASGGATSVENGGSPATGGSSATGGASQASGGASAGGSSQVTGGASSDPGAPDAATPRDAGPQPAALWVGDLETGDFSQYETSATWNFEGTPVPGWPEFIAKSNDRAHLRLRRSAVGTVR